ncbi:MAG: hypothetical protein KF766_08130 [Rhodocyclaceae bacterium]|nr:hypothetical protein [Rhodocyclaceae bacterium]
MFTSSQPDPGWVLLIPVVAFLLLDHDYRLAFAPSSPSPPPSATGGRLSARRLNQMSQICRSLILSPTRFIRR